MTGLRPPPGDESVMPLARLIADEIASDGPITFARFMELATGHPEFGYYAASVDRVGRSGDFLTAPETHPIFGWLLARQVVDCWELMGADSALNIREEGAGRGTLAVQILEAIGKAQPAGLRSVTYDRSDLNPKHRPELQRNVAPASASLELVLSGGDERRQPGVVIANEFLDALPFHRLVVCADELRELFVDLDAGWFVERVGRISDAARGYSASVGALAERQIIEVSPAATRWMGGLARRLTHGFAIIVDYGYERAALHDADRFPHGTLKTYRQHDVGEEPFIHIGAQDITAHVDFTGILQSAQAAGLTLEGITSLAEFSAGLGLDELLMEIRAEAQHADEYLAARATAMALLNPSGLGRFRVAIFSAGVAQSSPLRGLQFRMPGL